MRLPLFMPNMVLPVKNIIFDWSGTLCNDVRLSFICTRHTIRHFGGPAISFKQYREQFDLPVWKFYRCHLGKGSVDEVSSYYFDYFSRFAPRSRLFPAVKEVLRLARKRGIRLFVFSTARQDLLDALLRRNGIKKYFTAVVGSVRDKERSLPGLCRRYGLRENATLFVGDMEHDILAAKKSGVLSGAFLSGYHAPGRLLKLAPDFVWNDFGEILKFLISLSSPPRVKSWGGDLDLDSRPNRPCKGPHGGNDITKCNFPIPTVGALIFNKGEIFLIQTHKWGTTFGIPGGKIKKNEPMEKALRREIREETGLVLKKIRWALVQDSIHSREFYKKGEHFLLLNFYAESTSRKFRLNNEAESGFWIDPGLALKLRLNEPTRVLVERFLNEKLKKKNAKP